MPKVSVIVPIYKVEKYIERCARSLFEQTLDDLEYIFVNDCTPDRSMNVLYAVLEDYPERKTQVKIINNEHNEGLHHVRIKGMNAATGDYFIHCDSDDWVDKEMYAKLYDFAIDNGDDLVWCDYYRSNGKIHIPKSQQCDTDKVEIFKAFLSYKIMGNIWSRMISRELYTHNKIFKAKAPIMEDVVLFVQFVYCAQGIGYLPKPYYYYYYNNESYTADSSDYHKIRNMTKEMEENALLIFSFFKEKGLYPFLKKEIFRRKFGIKYYPIHVIQSVSQCRLWTDTFPELNFRLFFSPVRFTDKLIALSILTRLYPIAKHIRRFLCFSSS